MRPSTDQVQVVPIDLIYQQPIGFDVAVAEVLPVAAKRVILAAWRQWAPFNQERKHLAQPRHVLAAFLRKFHIAPKLCPPYKVSH